jgi:D-beta-D-heptose 7-phosphate kinase/D-beta-D-heptose 1-phosphate adenosyltransferase
MIVFTNGCFDILHLGHIELLKYAKSLGDVLIVGLNSDKSIKRLKGDKRPINDEITRKTILESLKFVDSVIIFGEDTPLQLIKQVKPNIIVKGGDYKKEDVVGYEFEKYGLLEIKLFNYIPNKSTTSIIEKIKNDVCI